MIGGKARVAARVLADAYVRPNPRAADGPLVTVIIAAYNRSAVLRFALASVLAQTYARLEVLVVGDACTDDSERVVAAAGDSRVRWINLDRNTGSQAGPNQAGLEAANGELIAYLGQDDLWLRDHVALLVADAQRRGADLSYGVTLMVWPKPLPARGLASPAPGEFVAPSALIHRRDVAINAGGWRDHRTTLRAPDADLIWRLREQGARFSHVEALCAVKFPSTWRPGSYRDGRSEEQAAFARRLGRRSFVARELALGALLAPFRPLIAEPEVAASARATPGGLVAEYRRIRGLDREPDSG